MFNLFSSSILTDGYHFACSAQRPAPSAQRPGKDMPFQQIIMYALQCQHDTDVHLLFCFNLDLHITCSRGCV